MIDIDEDAPNTDNKRSQCDFATRVVRAPVTGELRHKAFENRLSSRFRVAYLHLRSPIEVNKQQARARASTGPAMNHFRHNKALCASYIPHEMARAPHASRKRIGQRRTGHQS